MHHDQLSITAAQVAALVADELPELAAEPVEQLAAGGTVNAIFRVGTGVTARFPLRPEDPDSTRVRLEQEAVAAAELVGVSPFPVPRPVHVGGPGHGYPMPWSAQTWLDGHRATPTSCESSSAFARDLATLTQALRAADMRGRRFSGTNRGGVLGDHNRWVEECLRKSEGLVDTRAVGRLWSRFRELPREDPDVMSHTDLIPGNLLVEGDRLVGVLDSGDFQAADPALDLVSAWHLLGTGARAVLRRELGCSDLQWERGKAWALEQAMGVVWYYVDTNPLAAEMGRTTLERLLADAGPSTPG
jgi:aminoglycoside phosphotransferase (APT) family kinase protein